MKKYMSVFMALIVTAMSFLLTSCETKVKKTKYNAHYFDYFDTVTTIMGYEETQEEFNKRLEEKKDNSMKLLSSYGKSDSSEQYVNIKVEVNGEKVTIENAYSENKWASINQIRIYDAQVNTEDGITDLPSAVKTYISKFYTTFTTRFNNESFRNILLAKTELTIDFADANNDAKFAEFIEIQKRQLDSYEDYSSESINFLAGWWELVDQYIVNYTPAE